jgi:hypothetical protein
MYVCTYLRVYVCMLVCMYVYMYVCMCVCMHALMHVCMYVCMCVCMYAHWLMFDICEWFPTCINVIIPTWQHSVRCHSVWAPHSSQPFLLPTSGRRVTQPAEGRSDNEMTFGRVCLTVLKSECLLRRIFCLYRQ